MGISPQDTSPQDTGHGTILIVEDDPLVRVVLAAAIEDADFDVTIAESADEALRQLSSGLMPRAVVTDIEMAGSLDGLGLARWLSERRAGIGILVVSGRQAPGVGDLPGGVRFLAKPFALGRLLDAIHAAIRDAGPGRMNADSRSVEARAA
jgi:DNA-binding response OmpR family regulator